MDLFTRGNPLNPYIIPFPDGWGLKGITWYAMSYLVGALLALALSSYRAYKDGYPKDFFINLFFFAFPMGIIGGRLWYVIASWQEFAAEPWRMFFIWEGGMAIQGGALLGIISGIGFVKVRRKGTNLLHAADWAVPTVLVAQMIGRWGNFFNREAFGEYTNGLFAMRLPVDAVRSSDITTKMWNHAETVKGVMYIQVHPTYLYESMWCLMVLIIMLLYRKHKKFDGEVFLIYLLGYGLGRFWIESLRTDQLLLPKVGLPVSQLLAGTIVIVSAILVITGRKKAARIKSTESNQ